MKIRDLMSDCTCTKVPVSAVPDVLQIYNMFERDYFTCLLKTISALLHNSRFIHTQGTMTLTLGAIEKQTSVYCGHTFIFPKWKFTDILFCFFSDSSAMCRVCSSQVKRFRLAGLFRTVFERGDVTLPGNYARRG